MPTIKNKVMPNTDENVEPSNFHMLLNVKHWKSFINKFNSYPDIRLMPIIITQQLCFWIFWFCNSKEKELQKQRNLSQLIFS